MKRLILFYILLSGCYGRRPPLTTGHEGKPLPSFSLLLSDSLTTLDTKNIPNGNPVVLFYFGPYCPYSRAQMQEILDNMSILKNIKFYIFTDWPFSDTKKFYNNYHLKNYKNIVLGMDNNGVFSNYFKVQGVPYMAIYNKDKILKHAFIGKIDGTQIKDVSEN